MKIRDFIVKLQTKKKKKVIRGDTSISENAQDENTKYL